MSELAPFLCREIGRLILSNLESWHRVSDKVRSILQAAGLKVATQNYRYTSAGITHQGQNTYAIIHAPRGDATEAIVLVTSWRTADGELNTNGVVLALALARYFKRKCGFCVFCAEESAWLIYIYIYF